MSFQSKLDQFYPVRAMNSPKDMKRSLSLKKSTPPCKSKKVTSNEIVEITSSDDDDQLSTSTPMRKKYVPLPNNETESTKPLEKEAMKEDTSVASNSSAETIIYNLSPGTISSHLSPVKKSPGSAGKYFSPTKKRLMVKKNLFKKNLSFQSINPRKEAIEVSERFTEVCKGLDDKTVFLLTIINDCLNNEALKNLLDENSQVILKSCMHTAKPGARLVCRLYWLLPLWYRYEKLSDIACEEKKKQLSTNIMEEMLSSLVNCGLLISNENLELSFDDCISLLKAPEVIRICKHFKQNHKNKEEAVNELRKFCNKKPISNMFNNKNDTNNTRVMEMLKAELGRCFKLSDAARSTLNKLYVLMYLGIDYSILTEKKLEFVLLNDKSGQEVSPIDKNMVLDNASVVFQNKDDFSRYYEALMFYNYCIETTDNSNLCTLILQAHDLFNQIDDELMFRYKTLPAWLHRFTPPSIYIKILESGVQELKKAKTKEYYTHALSILDTLIEEETFRRHKKADWYAEKALILHKYLRKPLKAAMVLLKGLRSNLPEEMKQVIMIRAKKLAKQKNIDLDNKIRQALLSQTKQIILERKMPGEHIYKNPMEQREGYRGKLTYQIHTEDGMKFVSVEDYCIEHYLAEGTFTQGAHWEGRMVVSMFYLLFWDIIYTKPEGVEGIFMSRFHRHPLDMFTDCFYSNRKAVIDDRLVFIEESNIDTLVSMMKSTWDERPENEVSDIARSIKWDAIESVSRCLGPRGIAALCRRLATNYSYCHSGFPDVTLWNTTTNKLKILEVKSDIDKPSIKQLQWIQYLVQNGIDAGFCYVGTYTTRCKARPSAIDSLCDGDSSDANDSTDDNYFSDNDDFV